MADDITSGEGTSAAMNEALSAVQAMSNLMASMVGQSKQMADNLKAAAKSANSTSSAGMSAHAGDAGNTGAGRRTDMSSSLGTISDTGWVRRSLLGPVGYAGVL